MSTVRRDWLLFTALTFAFGFGFAVYGGVFQNFYRAAYGPDALRYGTLESLREVPGLLAAFLAGTLVALAEPRVGAVALLISAVGVGLTGGAGSYWSLVAITAFWSIGAHVWFSLSPGITLALAEGAEGGKRLGQMGSVGALATLAGLGVARLLVQWLPYRAVFAVAGVSIGVAALLILALSHRATTANRRPLVFRRQYGWFYFLTFLEGCRRQIFGTFASFVLIAVYGVSVRTMLTLAFVNAALAAAWTPYAGKLVDRHGERRMLVIYYAIVVFVFLGYATLRRQEALFGLFILDNLLFGLGIGITTYLHKIVRPGEMTPSLAMGTTMNHVAAVVVPVLFGALWHSVHDYRIPFWIGSGVALVSLATAVVLPAPRPHAQTVPEPILECVD